MVSLDDDVQHSACLELVAEELVSAREQKSAGTISLDFDGLLSRPLLLREDVREGCGGQTWPAGMVLAKYLLREPQLAELRGRKILELGAGSGLVGLAIGIALSGSGSSPEVNIAGGHTSTSIHITDQLPMLSLMQHNIAINAFSNVEITAGLLDWGSAAVASLDPPDIVIAAECIYFEPAFPLLLQTLEQLIRPHTLLYLCFKKRRKADLRFVKEARKRFKLEDVLDDPDRQVWSRENLFLYKITQK